LPRPSFINIDIFLPMFFFPYFKGILTPSYITWVREGTYPQSLVSNIEQNGNE
jgi:hypothetical protein